MVIYRDINSDNILVCPLSLWNEEIENNGQKIKRFTLESEYRPAHQPLGIHKQSTTKEKIELFMSYFVGRTDVIAKRFENDKNGTTGYVPACYNALSICPRLNNKKTKCSDCEFQNFLKFNAHNIELHLIGERIFGVYPMLQNETCRFLAFDFDGKECTWSELLNDVKPIRDVAIEKNISLAVEKSRSGKGIHFWIFFSEFIPVSLARKFGSSLITSAMKKNHNVSFKTYDRMIPSQDTLPKGGFGNLIALPLQKHPRKQGNSEFVDENFKNVIDQWNYLFNIRKYTREEIEQFIKELAPDGDLGVLHISFVEGEKPWERKKASPHISKGDFPIEVDIVRSNMIYIKKNGISNSAMNTLKRLAAFQNPEFYKAQAMRLSTYNIPRIISCSDETEHYICLPRGLENEAVKIIKISSSKINLIDKTNMGKKIDVLFNGSLYDEQQTAANTLLSHNNGILAATTAFGKTVIGAFLIAERKVNTLILVHRTNLLSQWVARLSEFLQINEEPAQEFTPKGRKKKKSKIGLIGGGKESLSGIVDVAIMQSLLIDKEVKDLVSDYGMIIVDECHHVSAFTFEKILKTCNAKYVYGLTATPTRQDGHHPIIYMQCGEIRYKVDALAQAEIRPFEHFVIPRFTRFHKPINQSENYTITDIYRDIQYSDWRNDMIIQDVISAIENNRNPIILTERTEHVKILSDILTQKTKNVISMTGGLGNKKSREIMQEILIIPENEPFILIATGKYVGEGFDMPRLDTLFLAMPISWKGTVQQYAGRLHRLFATKKEVQIYDYIDINIPMLEKMYQKRLKGYASIGYKAKGTPQVIERINSIFDSNNFLNTYTSDILSTQKEIIIVSPFLSKRRILSALSYLSIVKDKLTIITKPAEDYLEKERINISECINILMNNGLKIITKPKIHQKYAVIDQKIIWYGSINLLSYGKSEESIMRIESLDIAEELVESILK